MVLKEEDTIYRRYYASGTELLEVYCIRMTLSDDISTKDRSIHNEADVSIGTHSEEEECRGIRFKNHLISLMLK